MVCQFDPDGNIRAESNGSRREEEVFKNSRNCKKQSFYLYSNWRCNDLAAVFVCNVDTLAILSRFSFSCVKFKNTIQFLRIISLQN